MNQSEPEPSLSGDYREENYSEVHKKACQIERYLEVLVGRQ